MRVGQVKLSALAARRPQGRLPAADPRRVDGERNEDVRVPDDVVIEEVARVRAESVEVDGPAPDRNRDADFVLFVAFALEWKKPEPLLHRELKEWT